MSRLVGRQEGEDMRVYFKLDANDCQVDIGDVCLDVPAVEGMRILGDVVWISLKKGHTYEELKEQGFSCKVLEKEKQ